VLVGPSHAASLGRGIAELGKVDITAPIERGAAVRTIARELVAQIRQPGIASEAIDQARDALTSVALALAAANFKKSNSKLTESAPPHSPIPRHAAGQVKDLAHSIPACSPTLLLKPHYQGREE
jgi:hypothetical protein